MYALKMPIHKLHLKHRPFQAVSEFAKGYSGGINFGYFQRTSSHPLGSIAEGAVIQDGAIVCSMIVPGRPALIHAPGDPPSMRLRIQDIWGINSAYASTYRMLIQAGPWLVRGGDIVTQYGNFAGVNPAASVERVAVGILDQETVIVATSTCTLGEMARWLRDHGCMNAIAGDGGSSVSLVVDGKTVIGSQLVPNALVWEKAEVVVQPQASTPPVGGPGEIPFYYAHSCPSGLARTNFSWREFACKGTGRLLIAKPLVDMCQYMRTALGGPLSVTSAYRAPSHNAREGGETDSLHTMGIAIDIAKSTWGEERLIALARGFGWGGGLGRYQTFLHFDLGPVREWRG